jgi:hypothetical protein
MPSSTVLRGVLIRHRRAWIADPCWILRADLNIHEFELENSNHTSAVTTASSG